MTRPGAARPCGARASARGGAAPPTRSDPELTCARWLVPAIASLFLVCAGNAGGAEWRAEASIASRVSVTDNVRLAPDGQRESDLILDVTPGIRLRGEGARLRFDAAYAPQAVGYAHSSDLNNFYNRLNASASLEAIEKFFFVDARANVSQQFVSAFAPRPTDLTSSTANRTEVWGATVSPYFRGQVPGGTTYLLRNDSTWTDGSGDTFRSSYSNTVTGRIENTVRRIGWSLEYNNRYLKYQNSNELTSQLGRARLIARVDPQLDLFVSGGYEENNYALTRQSGSTYGGGGTWRPTERTNIAGSYERRFFGPSYEASFDHRTRLTAWRLGASRNTSNYPELAFTIPPGNTAALLNAIFAAKIPDPAQREAAVQQFINQAGLPSFLLGPVSFYTEQIFLREGVDGSFAILGARNTITFAAYWADYEQISGTTGTPLPDAFGFANKFSQYGASVNWGLRVTPLSTANLLVSRLYTDTEAPTPGESTQNNVHLTFTTRLSPKTDATLGLRYTVFDSTVVNDYKEAAAFGALTHRF